MTNTTMDKVKLGDVVRHPLLGDIEITYICLREWRKDLVFGWRYARKMRDGGRQAGDLTHSGYFAASDLAVDLLTWDELKFNGAEK